MSAAHFLLFYDPKSWTPVFGKRSCLNKSQEYGDVSMKRRRVPGLALIPSAGRCAGLHAFLGAGDAGARFAIAGAANCALTENGAHAA